MDEFLKQMRASSVTIRVGQGEQAEEFSVPKDLLCTRSEWFRNALKDDRFQEGRTGVIELPEDSPVAFVSFYYWLFNGRLVFADIELTEETAATYSDQLRRSIETWIFADKYSVCDLQDCALWAVCTILDCATPTSVSVSTSNFEICFSKTKESSPLRLLAADFVVARMDQGYSDAADLVKELSRYQGFVEALHEAQRFHHVGAGEDNRRRYQRIRHFASVLGADLVKYDCNVPRDLSFTSRWRQGFDTCWDCACVASPPLVKCVSCKGSKSFTRSCLQQCQIGVLCSVCADPAPKYND